MTITTRQETSRTLSASSTSGFLGVLVCMIFAAFLATGPQYVFAGVLTIAFLVTRSWRRLFRQDHGTLALVGMAVCGFALITFAAGLATTTGWKVSLGTAAAELYHLIAKTGLRGLIIIWCFLIAQRLGISWQKIAPWLLVLIAINAAYMLLQMYTGVNWIAGWDAKLPLYRMSGTTFRPNGFTGHPLTLGYCAGLMAIVGLANMFPSKVRATWDRHWSWLFALSFVTLILSQTRWPLAIVALFFVIMVVKYSFAKTTLRQKGFVAMVLALSLGLGWWVSKDRFADILDDGRPLQERIPRLVFWEVHWQMFKDQPLLGVGYPNRAQARVAYYNQAGYQNSEKKYAAHNLFLQVLADSGIVGLLGLCLLLVPHLVWCMRLDLPSHRSFLLLLAAVGFFSLMQNTLRDSEFVHTYWIALGLLLWEANTTQQQQRANRDAQLG